MHNPPAFYLHHTERFDPQWVRGTLAIHVKRGLTPAEKQIASDQLQEAICNSFFQEKSTPPIGLDLTEYSTTYLLGAHEHGNGPDRVRCCVRLMQSARYLQGLCE